jgi:hypothetical protein
VTSGRSANLPTEHYLRIGFAAGPIPIYFLLPLAPFDEDLLTLIMGQPLQLLLAAVAGLLWTVRDISLLNDDVGTSTN